MSSPSSPGLQVITGPSAVVRSCSCLLSLYTFPLPPSLPSRAIYLCRLFRHLIGQPGSVVHQLQRVDFITRQVCLTREINNGRTERSGMPLSYRSWERAVSSSYAFCISEHCCQLLLLLFCLHIFKEAR